MSKPDKVRKKEVLNAISTDNQQSRRTVMSWLAGTAIGSSILSLVSSEPSVAKSITDEQEAELGSVLNKYQTKEDLIGVFSDENALLGELAERKLLEAATPENLPIENILPVKEMSETKTGAAVNAMLSHNGFATAHIEVKWQTKGQEVVLIARPEEDRTYAFVDTKSTTEKVMLEAAGSDASTSGVTTMGPCMEQTFCYFTYEEECIKYETHCCPETESCSLGQVVGFCYGCHLLNCHSACGYY